jgi:FtsP/CotA-like multicopper oxidase with cupredoxin domain
VDAGADTPRTVSWLVVAALLVAMLALGIAIVALARSQGSESAGSDDGMGMNMSGGAMSGHMAAVSSDGVPDATVARGGQPLPHSVQGGVWVFRLEAKPVRWPILDGTRVTAFTYNGTVPGPEIRVPYGQHVRVEVKNSLPEPTSVHWHGLDVPNPMDGVPGVTQQPIAPGASFSYEFDAVPAGRDSPGGTFLYHTHGPEEDRQFALGLSGAFIIEPKPKRSTQTVERTILIQEWNVDAATGATRPAMEMDGMLPTYFTLNGKSFPATETVNMLRGQRGLFRLVGAGSFTHPMHLHGADFTVVAKDGHPLSDPYKADVIQVGPGERYDITFSFSRAGKWIFHCHIGHHLTNGGSDPGGLLMVVNVT